MSDQVHAVAMCPTIIHNRLSGDTDTKKLAVCQMRLNIALATNLTRFSVTG